MTHFSTLDGCASFILLRYSKYVTVSFTTVLYCLLTPSLVLVLGTVFLQLIWTPKPFLL